MLRLPTIETAFTKEQLFSGVSSDIRNNIITTNVSLNSLANDDSSESFYEIGNAYYDKQQYKKALAWYKLSADRHYQSALLAIGFMYRHGKGVSRNYLIALEYFLGTYRWANSKAALHIASMFQNQEGVPLNKRMEYQWFLQREAEFLAFNEEDHRFCDGYFFHEFRIDVDEDKPLEELISETTAILDEQKEKASIKNKIKSLEQKNLELEAKIQSLQISKDSLEEVVNQLNTKVQLLENQNGTTETEKKLAIMEIELLKKENHIMENSTKENTKLINSIQKSLRKERENNKAINQRLENLERIFRQINIKRNNELDDSLNRSNSVIIDDNNDLCYDNE